MRRLIPALIIACAIGCEPMSSSQSIPWQSTTPVSRITVVVTNNCIWCDRQKQTLDSMLQSGELAGVDVRYIAPTYDYPATSFPTIYYCRDGRCYSPVEGYQSREAVLEFMR